MSIPLTEHALPVGAGHSDLTCPRNTSYAVLVGRLALHTAKANPLLSGTTFSKINVLMTSFLLPASVYRRGNMGPRTTLLECGSSPENIDFTIDPRHNLQADGKL
jgi:hypothetical protein